MATRLAPTVSPDTEFFWNGLREHKLLIQVPKDRFERPEVPLLVVDEEDAGPAARWGDLLGGLERASSAWHRRLRTAKRLHPRYSAIFW